MIASSVSYAQFGEPIPNNCSNKHCKIISTLVDSAKKIYDFAMKIWLSLFPQYCTQLTPSVNNINAPAVGQFISTDVRISNYTPDTLEWKKELIKSAEQSIEISGNYAGGKVFREVLDLMKDRMNAKIELKVHLLFSPDLLEAEDIQKIEELQKLFPNRFYCLIADRVYKSFYSEENHVKLLVVDEKYFVLGGTGIHENMSREVLPNDFQFSGNFKSKLLDKTQRDTEVVGRGDVSKTMRNQFFNLLRIWEHRSKGRAQSRYFELDAAKSIANSEKFDEEQGLVKNVQLKFVVSGPEHRQENPIVEEYASIISNAKTEISIANMIFNPHKKIRRILKQKKQSGMPIKGHFNGTENASKLHYVHVLPCRSNYDLVTHAYEHDVANQMYHKKVMTVDQRVTIIGTANLGTKSAEHDYEAIVVMDDVRVASLVNQALAQDVQVSKEYTGTKLNKKRLWNLVAGRITAGLVGSFF